MKASGRNPADMLAVALLSVGALSLGLLSLGRFDPVSEPFQSILVFSRTVSSVAVLGLLYPWLTRSRLRLEAVRVRA